MAQLNDVLVPTALQAWPGLQDVLAGVSFGEAPRVLLGFLQAHAHGGALDAAAMAQLSDDADVLVPAALQAWPELQDMQAGVSFGQAPGGCPPAVRALLGFLQAHAGDAHAVLDAAAMALLNGELVPAALAAWPELQDALESKVMLALTGSPSFHGRWRTGFRWPCPASKYLRSHSC